LFYLTVLELNDLVKAIEEEFGVTAAAPVAVAGGAGEASSIAFTKSLSSNTVIDLTASMICSLVIVNILP
jgi:ribosomal protein L7/L12